MQFERKVRLSFLKLFDNSLSKYLICERIPCMQWLFLIIYLTKLKRGLELAFGAHFLHGFYILYQLTKFQPHISFTGYQTKCVKFLFRQLMTS